MSYTWGYLIQAAVNKLELPEEELENFNFINRFPYLANEVITQVCSTVKPKKSFATFNITTSDVGMLFTMPEDFVAFNDDITIVINECGSYEAHDTDFLYRGYNQVTFFVPGTYQIPYDARWYTFDDQMQDDTVIDVPNDILDCIPSYMASYCMKIDDEYKAAELRNEYEILFARIDNTDYKQTHTFKIGGDW